MEYFDVSLKSHKISKSLPKVWKTADKDSPETEMFVLEDFSMYAKKLFDSLVGIKMFYEKEFNADNTNTIDEYIDLFNISFGSFINELVEDSGYVFGLTVYDVLKSHKKREDLRFFSLLEDVKKSPKYFTFDEKGKVNGFNDATHKRLSRHAKQLFMIEKMCSFTTRKFWQNEITSFKDLDLKKPYKILVKCIMSNDWRKEKRSKKLTKYMESRKYYSTSLINEKTFTKTFFSGFQSYALLLVDYDNKEFVCASPSDDYSEEVIDRINMLSEKKVFSDVLLQDKITRNKKIHKFFAEAVECETPKNILHCVGLYSEINFKNIKPKAVIAPNEDSFDFAQNLAKEYGDLPVLKKYEQKM